MRMFVACLFTYIEYIFRFLLFSVGDAGWALMRVLIAATDLLLIPLYLSSHHLSKII